MITCIIVDDEPLAREGLTDYVARINFLQLLGTAPDPLILSEMLEKEPADLLFLDIHMPYMSGLDFLKTIRKPPMVILTTAYANYAIESYQLKVLDYLLKPITFERFMAAAQKARDYFQLLNPLINKSPDYFFIKCEQVYEKIFLCDILFVQALENYVMFHTVKGKFMTLMPLQEAEKKLGDVDFMRVHKSYIVATNKVEQVDNYELVIQRIRVPVSRSYRNAVIDKLVTGRLWKRE